MQRPQVEGMTQTGSCGYPSYSSLQYKSNRHLTGSIKQLAERYATPIPRLSAEAEALSARVNEHLKKMGFAWE